MNKDILDAWNEKQYQVKAWINDADMDEFSYSYLLKNTIQILFPSEKNSHGMPDHNLITEIDNGDYQGTIIFVIGGYGYQPPVENHWYTSVYYGSCSGCDTLEGIRSYKAGKSDESQLNYFWTLCLHMMQKMKRFEESEEDGGDV